MKKEVIQQWDQAAEQYARIQKKSPFAQFNRDFVQTLTQDLAGQTVLDAGCGDGCYSEYFRRQGALVTACDGSPEMVKVARSTYPSIQFDVVDLQKPLPYQDKQFDLVFCNLVLMDIENIEALIVEVARTLKPGGAFTFSILHPCFYIGKWETDRLGRKTYRKIYDYLNPRSSQLHFWGQTTHYHRPLSYYLNLMAANHIYLEKLYEPAMPQVDYNAYRKNYLTKFRIFLLVYIRLFKYSLLGTKPYPYQEPSTRIPFLVVASMVRK